ncbi:hypothetical protein PMAYCL1PPCAC_06150, partial [Pristionchus mayeri]
SLFQQALLSQMDQWPSYPIEFVDKEFPTLESTAAAGKPRKRNNWKKSEDEKEVKSSSKNRLFPNHTAPPNYWKNRKPSVPEYGDDDVKAANEAVVAEPSFSAALVQEEKEIVPVKPEFFDKVTDKCRYEKMGFEELAIILVEKLQSRPPDPTQTYRTLTFPVPMQEFGAVERAVALSRPPDPSATPKWRLNLPDKTLTEEYTLISYLRPLPLPVGPSSMEMLMQQCPYLPVDKRKLPLYKTDPIVVQPKQTVATKGRPEVSVVPSDRPISTWTGPSNDVRSCGSSASSSHHDNFSHYGRQNKQTQPTKMMEFRNSSRPQNYKGDKGGYGDSRDTRYNADECRSSRLNYNHEWDLCYEYPSRTSSRLKETYGGGLNDSHRSESRDFDDYDDSGCQPDYEHERYSEDRGASPPAEPIDTVITEHSTKTPSWIVEQEHYGRRRNPMEWRTRLGSSIPQHERILMEKKEKSSGDQKREDDPDARHFWRCDDVPLSVRRAFRCLEGVPASSSAAFADDIHRVELCTWSGEEDETEVTARMREKYGIEKREKEEAERTVLVALPRTSISLVVGAGGEAEILFDSDCTDVLVKGVNYEDIGQAIHERVLKTRDFVTYTANRSYPHSPSICNNTIITLTSPEESKAVRERLILNGVEAKKIPRDLITGNWDGSYAKRECMLELDWERHGTHGLSVRFKNLSVQNNLVDRIMKFHSEYFMSSYVNMEEYYNKMYVAVPFSPFPVDDDIRYLKKLLEENGVELHAIVALKSKEGPQMIEGKQKQFQCRQAINRRILRVAIQEGVWGGFHPTTAEEWKMMLDEGRFSWEIEMLDDREMRQKDHNSATVVFDSFEQGERIAERLQKGTPNPLGDEKFILNKEDRKGVFARAKLRVHYNVPVHVHALVKERLRQMDQAWRVMSRFSHAYFNTDKEPFVQWSCLITRLNDKATPPGFCRLVVEGFPRSCVEDSCAQLLEVVRGEVVKFEGVEWLLTGIGRNMANDVAKEALVNNKVLLDFNVLGKEIRLIGEKWDRDDVTLRLKEIVEKRDSHVIRTRLSIRQPVYMNRASDAIGHCGGTEMMERVIGGCRISVCTKDEDQRTLRFEGTVAAYDRLREFLADLDDTLRESAKAEYEKMRKTNPMLQDSSLSPLTSALLCPICCCRPSVDFYRLEACGHVYCTACIYHQLQSELSSRSLPLVCRRDGCGRKLVVSDLLRLLLGRDPEVTGETGLEHLDEMKLRPLVSAIVSNALQTKRDRLMACRTADCAGIFPRLMEEDSIVRCKACEKTACGACGYESHRGVSCQEYENLRENVDVSIASYMKNKKVRKCPNESCSAVIEKTVGCNHMECPLCRTHFCWLCGYASNGQGEIYAHMQNDHGGNGLHMDDGEMFMLQFDD